MENHGTIEENMYGKSWQIDGKHLWKILANLGKTFMENPGKFRENIYGKSWQKTTKRTDAAIEHESAINPKNKCQPEREPV